MSPKLKIEGLERALEGVDPLKLGLLPCAA